VLGFVRVAYETLTYMDTIPRFLLALFLLAVTFAPGCVGGGVFFKERLVGRFAMWAVDGLADNSVVEESEDGRAARVLIPATVFAVGFNDQFVIAKRHPKSDHQIDSSTTEFYVVSVLDGHVHGPVDYENFSALRARLGVPASLDFSRVIEQLAHQPSNTQQKPTVGFGLAIYRTISLTND
jgi:hypothetical protein